MPVYGKFIQDQMQGVNVVDWDTDVIKVALLTSSYTPIASSHTNLIDVNLAANEVVGTGYTASGMVLGTPTFVFVGAAPGSIKVRLDATDSVWTTATITARYAVLFKNSSPWPLIAYIDFGTDKTSTAGDFTIQWNASGIIEFTI
jgi:hypothetical protein